MISVRNLTKIYKLGSKNKNVVALNSVSIDFPDKGLVFLLGKSGSGKSTLLNTIGGLDTFDSGEIIIKGKSSADFKQSDFDSYRNTFIGFIFQEYNILEEFSIGKNLALALELQGKKPDKHRVKELLEMVDLGGYYKRKPNQISGGQKQRVAIARALIKDPEIIMADEPTGALDSNTGKQIMETLKKLSKQKLVIIVSHDREFAEIYGDRIIELKDGVIIRDEVKREVMAQKSATGVSFIDDKIVHIKKGQQISRDDLLQINRMILNNSEYTDTIISFDNKSNDTVKKTAFITDEGNREVFKTTTQEDIVRSEHNPKDFKMIKSKLRFKDSLKMGASSLKHKPIRLILTIILSVVAFTMFGVVNTLASFDQVNSAYQTIQTLGSKTLAIANKESFYQSGYPLSDSLIETIEKDNSDYTFYKVIGNNERVRFLGLSDESGGNKEATTKRLNTSGIMMIDNSVKSDLDLKIIYGNMPKEGKKSVTVPSHGYRECYEICISKNLYNSIIEAYKNITDFNSLSNQVFEIYFNDYFYFKIVGVVEDGTNLDKYANLTGDNNELYTNRTKYEELDAVMKYSLANMCYVANSTFEELSNGYASRNAHYEVITGEEKNYVTYFYIEPSSTLENKTGIDSYIGYKLPGVDIHNLTGDQVFVEKDVLTSTLGIPENEIESRINGGLKINIGYLNSTNTIATLDVVGYHTYGSNAYIANDAFDKYFIGSDYVITKLKHNASDKSLIEYCYNYTGNSYLSIQFEASPTLSGFGRMIEEMTSVLVYVALAIAVFAGLMLMNFISTSIVYKKREIGVLRAIGARGKDVFSIFFSESMIICIINIILSVIASSVICSVINNSLMTDLGMTLTLLVFGFVQVLLIALVAIGSAFISSFFPVYKLAKKNPIDSINNR